MVDEEVELITSKVEKLEKDLAELQAKPGKVVHNEDMNEALIELGKKHTKKEIEDMIWEVDENLDGCVDWEEFKLMYSRNIADKTGLEPFQLFNVVQFMMYDKDSSGQVSIDETMTMLFQRYGKERLESVRYDMSTLVACFDLCIFEYHVRSESQSYFHTGLYITISHVSTPHPKLTKPLVTPLILLQK